MENVPDDVTLKDYFEQYIPDVFGKELADSTVSGMEGTTLKLQFDITGEGGGKYGVIVKDAKELSVQEGDVDDPSVKITMDVNGWRDAATGKMGHAADLFTDIKQLTDQKRMEALLSLKGKTDIVLTRKDGSTFTATLVFNGTETPAVEINTAEDVWSQIMSKEIDAPRAFMSGQLSIKGDMPFALSLNQLMS